jgi:streptogramin lyase
MQRIRRASLIVVMLALTAGIFASAASAFPTYFYSSSFGEKGTGNGQFESQTSIDIDVIGDIWVAEGAPNNRIQSFGPKGEYVSQITKVGSSPLGSVSDIAFSPKQNLWAVRGGNVVEMSPTGEYRNELTGNGGPAWSPENIAIDSAGNVWVTDIANDHVQKYNSEGKYLSQFGSPGTGNGQFSEMTGIDTDAAGNVWVVDFQQGEGSRIEKFSSEGTYLGQIANGQIPGWGYDTLTIDAGGNLWVSELSTNYVKVFNPEGQELTKFGGLEGAHPLDRPRSIAFDLKGDPQILGSYFVQKWTRAPIATTAPATNIKGTEATLGTTTNPQGYSTTVQFEYGTTTSYGSKAPAVPKEIGSGNVPYAFNQSISGLATGTKYHFRVVAKSEAGTTYGKDLTFTTMKKPVNLEPPYPSPTVPDQGLPESIIKGEWSGPPTSYSYQWQRCNSAGAECANISGATSSSYTPVAADVGKKLRITETATNEVGSTEATSPASGVVTPTTITEYALAAGSVPVGITTGPDGNLWYTASETKIGKITTAGVKTEYGTPIGGPLDITTGPDGNLWFATYASGIGKSTTSGAMTKYGVAGASGLWAITAGPDGNLWFVATATNQIGKITTSGTVTLYSLPAKSEPVDITTGPDGNLWFTNWQSSKIGKITTSGTITEYSLPTLSRPEQITAGPGERLWYTVSGTQKIGKITTSGTITEYSLPAGSSPDGIVEGPEGKVWFTNYSTSKVGRITSTGAVSEYSLPAESLPTSITKGPDGNLWFTEGNGKIGVITP